MGSMRRACRLLYLVTLVAVALGLALGQEDTPTVTPQPATDAPALTAAPAPAPAPASAEPTAEPATAPAPAPSPSADGASTTNGLTNDMRAILRKVGSLPCSEDTRSRIFSILYGSNKALHDRCTRDSEYQFYPYTGKLPTTKQVVAIVQSTACMQLFTGVILAEFPECDVDFVSIRTSAEVFLRVKKDVDDNRTPPSQAQFYEFYNLNRVVNLMNENATLIEEVFRDSPTTAAVSLSEMTRLMNPIVLTPGVSVSPDLKITIADSSTSSASAGSGGKDTQATDSPSSSGVDTPKPTAPLVNETMRTSSASVSPSSLSYPLRSIVVVVFLTVGVVLVEPY